MNEDEYRTRLDQVKSAGQYILCAWRFDGDDDEIFLFLFD